ncbi:E1 protein [Phodopus sungorus papillomavirus 1]|uniref:Replication protein E1 n=1 Tax=Phodopus sungorus papillomavirus 1 TaxID=1487796 RepID=W8ZCM3_9PAPI|nr:E1 protein [Phodopus sungorus papillomavirus 1]QWC92935.1 E1 [Phodopus sungorus papillomavirus 1]QWC92941.1 E1 [Phodopus sungorus papillomavirus 1]QWC92947.1 E1 [Phodopus sungorus papillomavirus 1]CDN67541.1 E1 protein [Phodopus sungorus papillomavirus 1]
MADKEGTDGGEGYSGWYIVSEAECADGDDSLEDLEALFDQSTQESTFIDTDEVDQGNSLSLFQQQLFQDDEEQLASLKRKYAATPSKEQSLDIATLSPRLASVSISPRSRTSKKKLFQDSGLGHETQDSASREETQEVLSLPLFSEPSSGTENADTALLRSSNVFATCLARFKTAFGCSFAELTRQYKSDKTCSPHWVVTVFGAPEAMVEAAKLALPTHCAYCQMSAAYADSRRVILLLVEFKASKSRETLRKLLSAMFGVDESLVIAEPPKERSVLSALFFYKKVMFPNSGTFQSGQMPEWIAKQTLVEHQAASAESFDLSAMIQWAYDNDYVDESQVAYNYALYAEADANAEAFLKSNCQAKYVKDCCTMVRLYKRQEMREMSMGQWVKKCCESVDEEGDWKVIAGFLRYQGVNVVMLLSALRHLFLGTPKKHCLVIYGPSDTGKSYFCNSLVTFLRGKVISFMNSKSQFWLQPLIDSKIGFLDDATSACWQFMDVYMRNALDGNPISLDMKHRAPTQVKLPPLLVTTNVDVLANDAYRFLHSRLQVFAFERPMPFDEDGNPQFPLTKANWRSFFTRLGKQLGLQDEEDADPDRAFRCSARSDSQPN